MVYNPVTFVCRQADDVDGSSRNIDTDGSSRKVRNVPGSSTQEDHSGIIKRSAISAVV